MVDRALHHDAGPARVGGRYVLLDEVGRGGMATVHRAHDEVLDRVVAVKLLHPHLAHDPAFLERFRREARSAAALSHPNVVAVHDWGESRDGAFLVLQLVEGLSLREVLRARGRLDPAEALAVLGPIAAGLGAAHAIGLVHRDVKPENLLIGRDGTVRITDFGLARAAASATSTFGADVLVGSPHYLSPEAVRGEPLDPRADVYALGVVLFECLTGRPPHEGDSPYSTAMAHTSRAVPPPSSRRDGLPASIDDLVTRATAMDRGARHVDAASFGRAFASAVPGGPATVSVPPSTEATRAFRRDTSDAPTDGASPPPPPPPPPPGRLDDWTAILPPEEGPTERFGTPSGGGPLDPDHDEGDDEGYDEDLDLDVVSGGRRRGRGWLALVLLVVLLGGSAAGGYLLWDRVIAPVTPVPSVQGAPEDSAREQLQRAGFEVRIASERPHDLATPAGNVLDQEPVGVARQGRTVTVILSAGPRQVRVADVVDAPAADASERLREDGLEPVVTEAYDDDVAPGVVVSTDPVPGTVLDEASDVTVTVSRGPAPIEVPEVVGAAEEVAAGSLEDLGLGLEVVGRRHDGAPAGTVLDQTPAPGETLVRGDVVEVVVSEGPELTEVPNVRGKRVEEAVAELEDLGFGVEVERRGGFRALLNPGRVYDQDPPPDGDATAGDTVMLYAYE